MIGRFSRHPWAWIIGWALVLRAPYVSHAIYDIDEGCYAAVAAAIVDGATEYRDAADLKFPGIYWTYAAVFAVFGKYAMHAVHAAATFFTLLTAGVLYRLAADTGGRSAGAWSAFLYVSLTTLFPANLAANCELFMNLPYAACAYFLRRSGEGGRGVLWAFIAGACVAAAMIYKQIGAVVGVVGAIHFASLWFFGKCTLRRASGLFIALTFGFAIPTTAMLGYLHVRGALDDFLFWTITYLQRYLAFSSRRLNYGLHFVSCFLPFVVAYGAAWGPASDWFRRRAKSLIDGICTRQLSDDVSPVTPLFVAWLVLSVAATLAGPRMYPHYWLQHLPPLCVIAGAAIASWRDERAERRRRRVRAYAVAMSLGSWLWAWAFVGETPPALWSPEPDYRPAVAYVRETTSSTARAFVWGWFPPLYVHTGLTPGTRFVNTQMFVTYRPEFASRERQKWITNAAATWIEVPEAWDMLETDFARHPPELILDTSPGNHHRFSLFPMRDFPRLARIVAERYRYEATVAGVGVYRLRSTSSIR